MVSQYYSTLSERKSLSWILLYDEISYIINAKRAIYEISELHTRPREEIAMCRDSTRAYSEIHRYSIPDSRPEHDETDRGNNLKNTRR